LAKVPYIGIVRDNRREFVISAIFFSHYLHWKKGLIALFENLVDSKSMSVGKRINQNFCRNYQMRIINSLLLNVPEFDDRPSVGDAARCCELLVGNI